MGGEQGEREPVHAECHAGGVGDLAVFGVQAPGRGEVIAVAIEAHAGGGLGGRADGNEQLEFQGLLDLALRDQLCGAAEKRDRSPWLASHRWRSRPDRPGSVRVPMPEEEPEGGGVLPGLGLSVKHLFDKAGARG